MSASHVALRGGSGLDIVLSREAMGLFARRLPCLHANHNAWTHTEHFFLADMEYKTHKTTFSARIHTSRFLGSPMHKGTVLRPRA